MFKILKYSFYDLMRSRWSYVYFAFYLALGFMLLFLNNDVNKAVITLMNIIIVLTPMIATICPASSRITESFQPSHRQPCLVIARCSR